MASKGGFAEKEGLDLNMIQFKGDALALRGMLAGELESYEGNPGAPLLAASRGADVRIIGCYWPVLTNAHFRPRQHRLGRRSQRQGVRDFQPRRAAGFVRARRCWSRTVSPTAT